VNLSCSKSLDAGITALLQLSAVKRKREGGRKNGIGIRQGTKRWWRLARHHSQQQLTNCAL